MRHGFLGRVGAAEEVGQKVHVVIFEGPDEPNLLEHGRDTQEDCYVDPSKEREVFHHVLADSNSAKIRSRDFEATFSSRAFITNLLNLHLFRKVCY